MKLNLGCGHVQPSGWVNVDGSNRAWLASRLSWLDRLAVICHLLSPTEFNRTIVPANLLKRFPWSDGVADAVYLGEILEHFTPADGKRVLRECHRVLKPGGIIRVRVPDGGTFFGNYIREYEATRSKPREQWDLKHTRWIEMLYANICVRRPKPWSSMGHFHKWDYDEIGLTLLLEEIGFRQVRRRTFQDSNIPDIAGVEVRDDLIVEGVKP